MFVYAQATMFLTFIDNFPSQKVALLFLPTPLPEKDSPLFVKFISCSFRKEVHRHMIDKGIRQTGSNEDGSTRYR